MDSQKWMACAILVIVIIGILGNILSFVLFSRPHMRSSSVNVLLCALSLFDCSLLILSVPIFVVPNIDVVNDQHLNQFMAYVLNILYPINLMMQTCSVYVMVMITLERWVAVCRPLQVRVWCTPKKSRNAILLIMAISFAYNFIRFFEYSFALSEENTLTYKVWLRDAAKHRWYYVGYYTILYIFTHFLVPFTVMALANGHVIVAMCKVSKARQMLTRQQRREQSTTVMLLIVTFVFAVCNTLPFILNVTESIFPSLFQDESTKHLAFWLNDLSNLLVILNSATTFIVYSIFSEKYRQTLIFILKNGCCATVSDYNTYTAMSRTASMRISSENGGQMQRQGSRMSTCSRSSDVLLKPIYMQKRGERFSSEYNERTCKHLAPFDELKLPKLPGEKKRKKMHKLSAVEQRAMPEITITFSEDLPES